MRVECDPVPMRYRGIYVQYMYVGYNYETGPNNPAGLTRMKLSKVHRTPPFILGDWCVPSIWCAQIELSSPMASDTSSGSHVSIDSFLGIDFGFWLPLKHIQATDTPVRKRDIKPSYDLKEHQKRAE